MLRPKTIVGHYELTKRLGSGAFGEVWQAKRSGALVTNVFAIKFPKRSDVDRQALEEEAVNWLLASGHSNVVSFIEAVEVDDPEATYSAEPAEKLFLLVSEYVAGGTLEKWLAENGGTAPSVEAAVEMMHGILAGLEWLHRYNVIHRDLKPANILLKDATPCIVDFGLSRVVRSGQSYSKASGSAAYMAPEAFRGKRNQQTDLWSAGVIFYQLLTGQSPFIASDQVALMYQILQEPHQPLPASVPAQFHRIIDKALAKDAERRYQSAAELRATLSLAYRERVSIEPPVIEPPVKSNIFVEDLGSGVKLELVAIPGGSFQMGSSEKAVQEAFADAKRYNKDAQLDRFQRELPQHRVTLPPFYAGKYAVTQAQYEAVRGVNPSHFKGARLPVEQVSWDDAQEFCRRLSQRTGRKYRLPSEAEWEYACRAGTTTPFAFGETISTDEVNYDGNYPYGRGAKGIYREKTVEVGSLRRANDWGLYDMHGNVWEWCEDVWHANYNGAPSDGSSWLSGGDSSYRMLRGGSWYDYSRNCRSANRINNAHDSRYYNIGFRVVVSSRTS